jgi:hypothetical protein
MNERNRAEDECSSLLQLLEDLEEALQKMIVGAFTFTFVRVPKAVYEYLLDFVGPFLVRFTRVLLFTMLWVAIVLGPLVVARVWMKSSTVLTVIAVIWLLFAVVGSVWGIHHIRRRRAKQAEQVPVCYAVPVEEGTARVPSRGQMNW